MELKEWLLIKEMVDLDPEVHITGTKISVSSLRIPPTLIFDMKEALLVDHYFSSLIDK